MNYAYEFELSRMDFVKMTVTQAYGRFSEGQTIWGKFVKAGTKGWQVAVVNDAGKALGHIPASHINTRRG